MEKKQKIKAVNKIAKNPSVPSLNKTNSPLWVSKTNRSTCSDSVLFNSPTP